MRPLRTLLLAVLPVILAGCYMSQTPLITPDKAAFPYEKIVFTQGGEGKAATLIHEGDAYVQTDEDGKKVELLFMSVGDDLYVAQMGGEMFGGKSYLYGVVKLNAADKTAYAYAVFADKADLEASKLPKCPDSSDAICLTELDGYVAYAKSKMATPQAVYQIQEMN